MDETLDLGVGIARRRGTGDRTALILPGAAYSPDAPLLWYARSVLAAFGYAVVVLEPAPPPAGDLAGWVRARSEAVLAAAGAVSVVIGKDLSSLAAPLVAERALPAVWLTPLLRRSEVIAALAAPTAPCLVVGSRGDPEWDQAVSVRLTRAEVLQLADADRDLESPGNPARSVEILGRVVDRYVGFLRRIG
jgi:hypothetical protein